MDMLCPECMGSLVSSDGQTAVCSTHGGRYQILFSRYPAAAPLPLAPLPQRMDGPMGSGDDLASLAAAAAAANARVPASSYEMQPITGAFCISHPASPAVCYCQTCRAPVCATCVFVFPGGIQLCPACASNPRPQVSPRRKRLVWWSVGLGIWCLLSLITMVVLVRQNPTNKADVDAIGTAFVFLTLLPSIIGVALGVATFDRRLSTPGIVWVGIISNGLVLLIWVLLMILGSMR